MYLSGHRGALIKIFDQMANIVFLVTKFFEKHFMCNKIQFRRLLKLISIGVNRKGQSLPTESEMQLSLDSTEEKRVEEGKESE